MSNTTTRRPPTDDEKAKKRSLLEEAVEITVAETGERRRFTMDDAFSRFAPTTKSGQVPSLRKMREFLSICKHRGLDPDSGDVWLVGYDGTNGPEFSVIVSYQALAKRAESNPSYEGIEYGCICETNAGEIIERPGSFVPGDETLVGGWAKVYRSDRKVPSYASVPLESYDKKRSLWNTHKSVMIAKCAKAMAMREAFPRDCGDMISEEEYRGETALDKAIEATERSRSRAAAKIRDMGATTDEVSADGVVEAQEGQLFATHPNAAEV